jgi:NAD(P)-dependent dehydrogenase (short-subunit alcohol dehydrogenase family)
MKLEGKTAIVTGAGSGIGRAITLCFAHEGARVVAVGRNQKKLEDTRLASGEAAQRVLPRSADVSDRGAVRELVQWAEQQSGPIHILVNNAAINVRRRWLDELTVEDFESIVDVALKGAFYCLHEVLPGMRSRGDGLIINVSSVAGLRANKISGSSYIAAKFGLSGLSRSVGLEEGQRGIRSCVIYPGEVDTPLMDDRPQVPPPEARKKMLQPEDLAAAALFVATLPPRATVPDLVITPTTAGFS